MAVSRVGAKVELCQAQSDFLFPLRHNETFYSFNFVLVVQRLASGRQACAR
jgi:hypothetical protein